MYRSAIKPMIDKITALMLLILFLPFMLGLAIVLGVYLQEIPFFVQVRTRKDQKHFKIYKFKTMKVERITKWGEWLRLHGIDEIPQILNILKGEMSLVGPRPLLPEYDTKYDSTQLQRFSVQAGITGLAQINGRNELDWQKRFELDVFYAQNCSFYLDMKILCKTFGLILKSKHNPISPKF